MDDIKFQELYQKYRGDVIHHTKELVKIKSVLVENEVIGDKVYRFGYGNYLALQYVLNLGRELGFNVFDVEGVCGHVEYGEGDDIFAVLSHVDVVPADGAWTNPPYDPVVIGNKLFGRGAIDDKGPAICSLFALKVLKDLGIKFKKRIRLIFGTDEESGSRGLKRYLEVEEMPKYGISPDAEFPIIYAEKGMITLDIVGGKSTDVWAKGGVRYNVVAPWVEFAVHNELAKEIRKKVSGLSLVEDKGDKYIIHGKSAHAMEPNNGLNAIKLFSEILSSLSVSPVIKFINENLINTRLKDMNLDITDEKMGDLTMNMGLLELGEVSRLGINIRYPINLNYDNFIKEFTKKVSEYGLSVEVKSHSKIHYVDPDSPFIKILHQSYKKYTSDETPLKTIGGGTYARSLKCAVAYGVMFPGEKEMAHEVDEFVDIDNLMLAGAILTDAIYSMGNYDED